MSWCHLLYFSSFSLTNCIHIGAGTSVEKSLSWDRENNPVVRLEFSHWHLPSHLYKVAPPLSSWVCSPWAVECPSKPPVLSLQALLKVSFLVALIVICTVLLFVVVALSFSFSYFLFGLGVVQTVPLGWTPPQLQQTAARHWLLSHPHPSVMSVFGAENYLFLILAGFDRFGMYFRFQVDAISGFTLKGVRQYSPYTNQQTLAPTGVWWSMNMTPSDNPLLSFWAKQDTPTPYCPVFAGFTTVFPVLLSWLLPLTADISTPWRYTLSVWFLIALSPVSPTITLRCAKATFLDFCTPTAGRPLHPFTPPALPF